MTAARSALVVLLGVPACKGVLPEIDLERMQDQRGYRAYEPAAMFSDGRVMRAPPAGTISRARELGRPAFTAGVVDDAYVQRVPAAIDRPLLQRGRDRFEVFCAACHGVNGDGDSAVARRMSQRKPPSLVVPPIAAFPPGQLFQVITQGYGLMPSYAPALREADRWAIVAYLRALALSHAAPLDQLPGDVRAQAERALP